MKLSDALIEHFFADITFVLKQSVDDFGFNWFDSKHCFVNNTEHQSQSN